MPLNRLYQNVCETCGSTFSAQSCRTKWCYSCREKRQHCSVCGSPKFLYGTEFCRTCAGKLKFATNPKVRRGLAHGHEIGAIQKRCVNCEQLFHAKSGMSKLCDSCRAKMSVCPVCGSVKSVHDQFCGNSCAGKWKFKNSLKVRNALKLGSTHPNRIAATRLYVFLYVKGRPNLKIRGPHNPNWGGGPRGKYASLRRTIMSRVEYKLWREAVFKRDQYRCTKCGKSRIYVIADHVLPVYYYPERIFDVDNGRTLCRKCHGELDTTGHKVKTRYVPTCGNPDVSVARAILTSIVAAPPPPLPLKMI